MREDIYKFYNLDKKEQIITLVKYKNQYQYYLSDREYWVMDWIVRSKNFSKELNGQEVNRFNIKILSDINCCYFLEELKKEGSTLTIKELKEEFFFRYEISNDIWDLLDLCPVLLIDFDSHILYTLKLYEAIDFSMYIPSHWENDFNYHCNSVGLIPEDYRFWAKDNISYLTLFAQNNPEQINDDF